MLASLSHSLAPHRAFIKPSPAALSILGFRPTAAIESSLLLRNTCTAHHADPLKEPIISKNSPQHRYLTPCPLSHRIPAGRHSLQLPRTAAETVLPTSAMAAQHDSSALLFDISVRQWQRSEHGRRPFPYVAEPQEVACFSKDDDGRVTMGGRASLKQFKKLDGPTDLKIGYDTFVAKRHDDVSIEHFIKSAKNQAASTLDSSHFVSYRNNLNKIGQTINDPNHNWEIDCCQVGTVVFLDIRKTHEDSTDDTLHRLMYTGYRFEAECTGDTDKPVNANSEFCSISSCQIAQHRVLLSSEIDCTMGDPKNTENPIRDYLELKTMNEVTENHKLRNMYKYRFPKYWLQSFYAGVPTIMLGLRSKDSIVTDVNKLVVHDLPAEALDYFAKGRERAWKPATILNFVDYVLSSIRDACANHVGCTLRVVYDPTIRNVSAKVVSTPEEGLFPRLSAYLKES